MGIRLSLLSQMFPPKPSFSVDDIPDLTGQVVIVTGANTGVGKEIAKALLDHNAKVYIAGRNPQKVQDTIDELKKLSGHEALFLQLDLGDLTSVKASAVEFLSKEKELHILFNNAGVMAPPIDELTVQGYDLTCGTNILGHFYFTSLLLPALLAGTKKRPDGKARVVSITSVTAYYPTSFDFKALVDGPERRRYSTLDLYYQSKLGNSLVALELARRYGSQGIVSTACNPGNTITELQRHLGFPLRTLIRLLMLYPTAYGALTPLWAGTAPEGGDLNGQFIIPWARTTTAPPTLAQDEKIAAELWQWCEEQCAKVSSKKVLADGRRRLYSISV